MPDSELIPVVQVASGEKFVNEKGITAIKDGIKAGDADVVRMRKPDWLRIRVPEYGRVLELGHCDHHVDGGCVHTRVPLLCGQHRQPQGLAGPGRTR